MNSDFPPAKIGKQGQSIVLHTLYSLGGGSHKMPWKELWWGVKIKNIGKYLCHQRLNFTLCEMLVPWEVPFPLRSFFWDIGISLPIRYQKIAAFSTLCISSSSLVRPKITESRGSTSGLKGKGQLWAGLTLARRWERIMCKHWAGPWCQGTQSWKAGRLPLRNGCLCPLGLENWTDMVASFWCDKVWTRSFYFRQWTGGNYRPEKGGQERT